MQAILILCYTDKTNLIKLIKSFNDEMNIYVHINSTSKELFEEDLNSLNLKNLTVIKKYNTNWGAYGHLLATIDLIKMAIANEDNRFIHIISGQDYKIKSNQYFYEHFEDNDNIYFSVTSQKNFSEHVIKRYTKGVFSSYFSSRDERVIKINTLYQSLYNKDRIGEFKDIYKGMLWCSMPIHVCKYVVNYIEDNPQFSEDLKHCILPEEFFFQTIIMNSKYKSNVVPTHLRYVDWSYRNGNSPAVLDETDFTKFKDSNNIFIRKVATGMSDELITLIDQNLLKDRLIDRNYLINTIQTKEFEDLPKESYNIINKYDDKISRYELFEIFNEIIECSSIWLGDTTDECEKLLSYFDNILEKYDLY